jgi:hypothetical protein
LAFKPPFFPAAAPTPSNHWAETGPVVYSVDPNSSYLAGGVSVTISGIRFANHQDGSAPEVLIGGVAATSVVVVSATEITCVVPAATEAGAVDVTVTTYGGSHTLVDGFIYYEAVITGVEPPFGPFGGGTDVVIVGFNFVDGSTVFFGDDAATNVVFIDSSHIACTTPSHAEGFVDVRVVDPDDNEATLRNGFKYTLLVRGEDFRRMPGVGIRDALNNAPNTATFSVDGESQEPLPGEEIEITDPEDGDRVLFRGIIQSVDQAYEGQTNQLVWNCMATDFTWLLNKYRPSGKYVNVSASTVVIDLMAKFAPGFTVEHVQTNLAPVSAEFDGTMDLMTCLSEIARSIGGGHWYVDYDKDMHFFHVPPPEGVVTVPTSPGPGTPITLTEDGPIEYLASFTTGYYYVRSTFLYSNGVESRLGPISAIVPFTGTNYMQMDDIPLGTDPGGGITCVGRRIYFGRGTFPMIRGWRINDNTTTSITVFPGGIVAAPIVYEGSQGAIITPPVTPPTPAPITAPVVGIVTYDDPFLNPSGTNFPPPNVQTGSNGNWVFQASAVYQDGTESLPSPFSNSVYLGQTPLPSGTGPGLSTTLNFPTFLSLPLFPDINGVSPAYYKIYAKKLPPTGSGGIIVDDPAVFIPHFWCNMPYGSTGEPDNTEIDYGDRPRFTGDTPSLIWPNPDGPYLEDTDPPEDIDHNSTLLIRDQPITSTKDQSQLRNRVTILGMGTSVTEDAAPGDSQLQVSDCSIFGEAGGEIIVNGKVLIYFAPGTNEPGPGAVFLTQAITDAIPAGSSVRFYMQINDFASQEAMGKVELDADGNPTDGVHEVVIKDDSLYLPQQLYMRANAELELFSKPIITVRYSTRDPKSKSGQRVNINLTNPPISGTFLIQDVSIDQIHDESDLVLPRYNVTASSVRFDLEDLLMQIGKETIGSGGAAVSTGLVGVGSIGGSGGLLRGDVHPQGVFEAPVGTTYIRSNGVRYYKQGGGETRFGWYLDMPAQASQGFGPTVMGSIVAEAVAITGTGIPIQMSAWANTNPGTPVYQTINGRYYRRFNAGPTINTTSYVNNGTAFSTSLWDRPFDAVARIAVADISSVRIFFAISTVALTDSQTIVSPATPGWYTAIAYRSDGGEGAWVGLTKNGANNLSTTSGLATIVGGSSDLPAEAILRIRWIPASGDTPSTVYFSINDGPETAETNNVPEGEPSVPAIYFGGTNKVGVNRFFYHKSLLIAVGE